MKNLKKMIATLALAVVMMTTVSTAKAGVMFSDLTGDNTNQPCTEQKETSTDWGILMSDFTGIIVNGFTGFIIVGAVETPVDCGVITHG